MSNGDEASVRRSCRSREVSSRYMLPTISSAAATANSNDASLRARRWSSPNSRSSSSRLKLEYHASVETTHVRSQSVERRQAEKESRLRGSAALWPSTALNNEFPTLADHLDLRNKIQTEYDRGRRSGEPWKENTHSGLFASTKSGALMSILNKSLDTNIKVKGVGRSSSFSLQAARSLIRNNDIKQTGLISPGRLSVDLGKLVRRDVYEDADVSNSNSNGSGIKDVPATAEVMGENGNKASKKIMKGSYVPARFLQDTLSRLRRMSEAGHMPENNHRGSKSFSSSSSSSSSWAMSPGRDMMQGNKHKVDDSECDPAKTGSRMSSMLNLGMEMLKGKDNVKGNKVVKRKVKAVAAQEEVLHQMRLLHNRCLQWRFVNARAQLAHQTQTTSAQDSIYRVWLKSSELRSRVVMKRIHFQKARHQHKVNTVIAAHEGQLEDWTGLKEEHEWAVRGTMECLDAATIKVPLVAGAKADVRTVKQVVSFAVDVMHGIRVNATKFLAQAEKVDALLPELAEIIARERALLQECVELLSGLNHLEVEERSLRTHLVQLHRQILCVS